MKGGTGKKGRTEYLQLNTFINKLTPTNAEIPAHRNDQRKKKLH